MRRHISNSAYGVVDYAAYPVAMLLVAPILLPDLGVAQYGVWMVATAAVSTGAIVASGFCDANTQYVAGIRSRNDAGALTRAVRTMVGINLLLGVAFGLISWALSPIVARHVAPSDAPLQTMCLWSLRIASLLMPVRALESVCISTQRAFERYGAAVRISIAARLMTLLAAVVLTRFGHGVVSIMLATAALLVLGTVAQLMRLQQLFGATSLLPAFDREATSALFGFGVFSWLQAVSGIVIGQADRLILGVSLGASAVASYSLCVQMAQPIYGIAAAALHFVFPYLAGRRTTASLAELQRPVLKALAVNVLLVALGTAAALLFGKPFLNAWIGAIRRTRGRDSPLASRLELRLPRPRSHRVLRTPRAGPCAHRHLSQSHRRRCNASRNGVAASTLRRSWPRHGPPDLRISRPAPVHPAGPPSLPDEPRRPAFGPGVYPVCEDA